MKLIILLLLITASFAVISHTPDYSKKRIVVYREDGTILSSHTSFDYALEATIKAGEGVYRIERPSFNVTITGHEDPTTPPPPVDPPPPTEPPGEESALLSWTAPTENTDDSDLTDLAGFKVVYNDEIIDIDNPQTTQVTVDGLTSDTCFTVSAVNELGIESDKTDPVCKAIN